MRTPVRLSIRKVSVALGLILFAVWLLPSFFSAERYRRRLETGLERALHRSVTFGVMSFRLLPRPGFSVENVVVREDPAFGSEPFAQVGRIECDLSWRSLWRPGLDFARLHLDHASFNLVRNREGVWNVGNLLLASGIASPPAGPPSQAARAAAGLMIEAEDARVNFKFGVNKKLFAFTNLRAQLAVDPAQGLVRYRLAGNPIRTDFSLPTPGVVELAGEWTPEKHLDGPLDATLRTRGALFYDWVPLVTGYNPEIFGVLDAEIHLTGSVHVIKAEGQCRLSQLHRWEQLPPSDPMPATIYFRGEFDRRLGRVRLESVDASFRDSHLHLTGSVDRIPALPELDLVLAVERSRLEDMWALAQRFEAKPGAFGLAGRLDGLLAIQGPWTERRYGGFLSARDVRLNTPSGVFPVSEVAVRIENKGARMAPAKLTLAPHVELAVEGTLDRPVPNEAKSQKIASPRYEMTLSAKAVPLADLLRFARGVGVRAVGNLDAKGLGSATFHLAGSAWPRSQPTLTGRAELQGTRLLVPGLTEPLNLPRARFQFNGDDVLANPVVAVIGTSVFSGRIEHRGDRKQPWEFDLRANNLSIEQSALWFDVLGYQRPLPLLARLPGLSSSADRRVAASNLFNSLNLKGRFSAPTVTYRALTLRDFRASVEISGRMVRVTGATFSAGGGRGQGQAQVNLTSAPARLTADVALAAGSLQSLTPRLPAALRHLQGSYSGAGHFETLGLTRNEMSANLQGQATVQLKNVSLGDFDPLEVLARQAESGSFEPARGQVGFRTSAATLRVGGRRIVLANYLLDVTGAKLNLSGIYNFDGAVDLDVRADLRQVRRRRVNDDSESNSTPRQLSLHLMGTIDKLTVSPEVQASRAVR